MAVGDGNYGRVNNRPRHDGKVSRELSGDVKQLTPEEIAGMDPAKPTSRTINVTDQERARRLAARAELTWEMQAETIRRANSILLSRTLEAIEGDRGDPEIVNTLAKAATIAKQFLQEERRADPDGAPPSREELEALARQ